MPLKKEISRNTVGENLEFFIIGFEYQSLILINLSVDEVVFITRNTSINCTSFLKFDFFTFQFGP